MSGNLVTPKKPSSGSSLTPDAPRKRDRATFANESDHGENDYESAVSDDEPPKKNLVIRTKNFKTDIEATVHAEKVAHAYYSKALDELLTQVKFFIEKAAEIGKPIPQGLGKACRKYNDSIKANPPTKYSSAELKTIFERLKEMTTKYSDSFKGTFDKAKVDSIFAD